MKENHGDSVTAPDHLKKELTEHFRRTVQNHFQRLAQVAQSKWERRFAGSDPSDACVTVRISNRPALRSAA